MYFYLRTSVVFSESNNAACSVNICGSKLCIPYEIDVKCKGRCVLCRANSVFGSMLVKVSETIMFDVICHMINKITWGGTWVHVPFES